MVFSINKADIDDQTWCPSFTIELYELGGSVSFDGLIYLILGAGKACPTGFFNDFKWWLAHVSPKWDWKHHSASDANQEM